MKSLFLILAIFIIGTFFAGFYLKDIFHQPQKEAFSKTFERVSLEEIPAKKILLNSSLARGKERYLPEKVKFSPRHAPSTFEIEVAFNPKNISGKYIVYFALTSPYENIPLKEVLKRARQNVYKSGGFRNLAGKAFYLTKEKSSFKIIWVSRSCEPSGEGIIKLEKENRIKSRMRLYSVSERWPFAILWIFMKSSGKIYCEDHNIYCYDAFFPVVVSFGNEGKKSFPPDTIVLENEPPSGKTTFQGNEIKAWIRKIDKKYWCYIQMKNIKKDFIALNGYVERYPVKLLLAPRSWSLDDVKKAYPSLGKECYTYRLSQALNWQKIPNQVYKGNDLLIGDFAEVLKEDKEMSLWILLHEVDFTHRQWAEYNHEWNWIKIDITSKEGKHPAVII